MARRGRPKLKFDHKIGAAAVAHMASGNSLRSFCEQPNTPCRDTIYRWAVEVEEFADQFGTSVSDVLSDGLEVVETVQQLVLSCDGLVKRQRQGS